MPQSAAAPRRSRPLVALFALSLLVSLTAGTPLASAARPAAGAAGRTLAPRIVSTGIAPTTWYVGPGTGSAPCDASVDFTTGAAGDTPSVAIQKAIAAATTGDTISLCDATYLLGATIAVDRDLTFRGESTANTIVDGDGARRLFDAPGRAVAFRGLTLRGGSADGGGGAVNASEVTIVGAVFAGNTSATYGGAIDASGTVSATDASFIGNRSELGAGAVSAISVVLQGGSFLANRGATSGGAVYANTVSLVGTTFSENTAGTHGGAIEAIDLAATDGTFTDNSAGQRGGAIHATGRLRLQGTTFDGNRARHLGGAVSGEGPANALLDTVFTDNAVAGMADPAGGALYLEGRADVTGGSFSGNRVLTGAGGAIYVYPGALTLTGTLFTGNRAGLDGGAVSGWDVVGVGVEFRDNTSGTEGGAMSGRLISLVESDFFGNRAGTDGAGIRTLTAIELTGGQYVGNFALRHGGALASDGRITIVGTVLRDNTAGSDGGAISVGGMLRVRASDLLSNVSGGSGGAIVGPFSGNDFADVSAGSRFIGNRAQGDGGAIMAASITATGSAFRHNGSVTGVGGALFSTGYLITRGNVFEANDATAGDGGAVGSGTGYSGVFSTSDTFVGNRAATGGAISAGGYLRLFHGTLVDNTAGSGDQVHWRPANADERTLVGNLFVGDGDCVNVAEMAGGLSTSDACPGAIVTREALALSRIDDAEGAVVAFAPAVGSPAIDPDGAATGTCGGILAFNDTRIDQFGYPRPAGSGCDAGSVEFQGLPLHTTTIRMAAYADGIEVTSGTPLRTGDPITLRAWVSSPTLADVTAGSVTLFFCADLEATPASCVTGSVFAGGQNVSVTDGTTGSDGIGEVSVATTVSAPGYQRLGARYRVPGGTIAWSEATTGTPTLLAATPVVLTWESSAGSVATTGTVPLRAVARTVIGGNPISGCSLRFSLSNLDGTAVTDRSAATNGAGVGSTSASSLSVPGVYLVTVTARGVCAAAMPAWGVVTVGPLTLPKGATGTVAGGLHYRTGGTGESVSFGIRVDATSGALAKGSKVLAYRTNVRFLWVSSAGWRLTSLTTGDLTTGVTGPFSKPACTTFSASDGVSAATALGRSTICGQLAFRGTLEQWDTVTNTWGSAQVVAFTARVADGGSVKGVDNTDWFGLQVAGGAPSITGVRPVRAGIASGAFLGRAFVY